MSWSARQEKWTQVCEVAEEALRYVWHFDYSMKERRQVEDRVASFKERADPDSEEDPEEVIEEMRDWLRKVL